jgi:hypothetical protein
MDMEHDSMDWIMPGVLLLVGMPFLLGALYMAGDDFLFRRGAQRVQGVVLDRGEGTPTLTVEYPGPDGAKHQVESFGSDLYEDVKVGDKVGVFVQSAKPEKGRLDFFVAAWMLPMIMGVFGAFFAIPGLLVMRSTLRKAGGVKQFARDVGFTGLPIKAEVVEIRPILSMEGFSKRPRVNMECSLSTEGGQWRLMVNGEPQDPFAAHANREWGVTYRVIAQWQDSQTGKTHRCESEEVETDPSFYLQFGTVTVLVDPENPDNCRVDMSFLPGYAALPDQGASA